eukprot:TRINITY_DN7631_c0_g1_i2.p1 TRINITY_DN7631_c0_g1~~TRINITY_DN7631_c0_g1_i2.p1  ORF type:complete len:152 (+),score=21.38 TRINITY_DN7631_c0_g1_i2:170-625(+)
MPRWIQKPARIDKSPSEDVHFEPHRPMKRRWIAGKAINRSASEVNEDLAWKPSITGPASLPEERPHHQAYYLPSTGLRDLPRGFRLPPGLDLPEGLRLFRLHAGLVDLKSYKAEEETSVGSSGYATGDSEAEHSDSETRKVTAVWRPTLWR